MIDIIGYIGTILVLISFAMKDIKKLRIINIIACVIFVYYSYLINAMPNIILNILVIMLNLYYLIKKEN